MLAPPFFAPLFEPPLLFDELPVDLELLPRDALLVRELLLFEPPRDALLPFEPLDFEPPRDALPFDDVARELLALELPERELPREAPAFEPPLLLEPLLLLAPERAAVLRFAEDEDADFEPPRDAAPDREEELFDEALPFEDDALFEPLLLLEPPLALPPLRPAAAFFADDEELFELEAELFELDPFDDEPLFFELPPLLFLDDDDADFLEAIWFSFS